MVPKEVTAPTQRRSRVIERRRKMFVRLLAVASVTLAAGFVPVLRWVWVAHAATDLLLGVYIWRLLQWKQAAPVSAELFQPVLHATQATQAETATVSSKAVFNPSAPPVPHAAPAEIVFDDAPARLSTRTG